MKDSLEEIAVDTDDTSRPLVMVDDEDIDFRVAERYYQRTVLTNPFIRFDRGEPFLEHLARVKAGEAPLPALVFMDINMPGMDGFEVIAAMREDPLFRSIPPVAMFSSSSSPRDMQRAREIGAAAYLVKPYNPRQYADLFAAIAA